MDSFVGYTLVDITNTGVIHASPTNEFERNQQRNWETVLQAIGLRAQPLHIQGPEWIQAEVDRFDFGEFYQGQHKIWVWTFSIEHSNVYEKDGNPVALLEQDFDKVPVTTYLSETARFMLPIFYTQGAIRNIYFEAGLPPSMVP